jgi:hypothetical protein
MSLRNLQSVLARLYTDSAFRAAFFRDPSPAGSAAGLTEAEQQLLTALDRGQVERFARSLQQKRLGLVRELLPAAAALLVDSFAPCFREYCDRHPSARERADEAIVFIDDLLAALPLRSTEKPLPHYWRDLLLCERLHLELRAAASVAEQWPPAAPGVGPVDGSADLPVGGEVRAYPGQAPSAWTIVAPRGPEGRRYQEPMAAPRRPEGRRYQEPAPHPPTPVVPASRAKEELAACPQRAACLRVAAFKYDVETLYPQAIRGEMGDALPDPCFLMLAPTPAGNRVRMKRINTPTAQLLTLCDGARTLGRILDALAMDLRISPADCPAFAAECRRFLVTLGEHGLIHWL